jgi:hypothetical protein
VFNSKIDYILVRRTSLVPIFFDVITSIVDLKVIFIASENDSSEIFNPSYRKLRLRQWWISREISWLIFSVFDSSKCELLHSTLNIVINTVLIPRYFVSWPFMVLPMVSYQNGHSKYLWQFSAHKYVF